MGASIAAWLDYFPNATITGIDTFQRVKPAKIPVLQHDRVSWFAADSRDVVMWGDFDIVIDDGLHTFEAQRRTFEALIGNTTGHYFIEDVWPVHLMNVQEMQNPWLKKDGYQLNHYRALLQTLDYYDHHVHDGREGHQPDSCIIEVKP